MERVTISLDDALLDEFDAFIRRKGYENRSEAIRDLLRERLETDRLAENQAPHAVAILSYVYNHHQRELAQRLTHAQHADHDLTLSTLHVHLDHENCLEVAVLRGHTPDVRHFAEALMAETGVRHGNLHLIPTDQFQASHRHGHDDEGGENHHVHLRPKT
jgi:CopG family nickel-responsive transcriptional regulator